MFFKLFKTFLTDLLTKKTIQIIFATSEAAKRLKMRYYNMLEEEEMLDESLITIVSEE